MLIAVFFIFSLLLGSSLSGASYIEVSLTIENASNRPLTLSELSLPYGEWVTPPPASILPGQTAKFRADSNKFMTGAEGWATYTFTTQQAHALSSSSRARTWVHNRRAVFNNRTVKFHFDVPFATENNCYATALAWSGALPVCTVQQGRSPTINFTFNLVEPYEKEFLLFGHAGSPLTSCENTIPAFHDALRDGANAIELDLSMTSEGVVIVWHDWDPDSIIALGRQVGGEGYLCRPWVPDKGDSHRLRSDLQTLTQFRKYNGYTKTKFPDAEACKLTCKGDPQCLYNCTRPTDDIVPTFDEFCAQIGVDPRVKYIFLDTKIPSGFPTATVTFFTEQLRATMLKYGIIQKGIFSTAEQDIHTTMLATMVSHGERQYSNYDRELPQVYIPDLKAHSAVKHAIADGERFASLGMPRFSVQPSQYFQLVHMDLQDRNRENIKRVKDNRIRFIAWTINKEADLRDLIVNSGIDALLTDDVPTAVKLLRSLQ